VANPDRDATRLATEMELMQTNASAIRVVPSCLPLAHLSIWSRSTAMCSSF
jgi:hypothetical protein